MTKKIIVSLSIIAAVAAVVVGGTIAYFSDTETSIGNTFTAGTLDLTVGGENQNASPDFTIGDVKPGDSGTQIYNLQNVGTIDGFLDLSGISVVDTEGANPESETGDLTDPGELSANINVTVTLGASILYTGALLDIAVAYDADVALAAGGSTTLTIDWSVPTTVGNDVQGDVATVNLTIELDQIELI